jgi:hypothetical protein
MRGETAVTCFLTRWLITVPIYKCGQICKPGRPRPVGPGTFSTFGSSDAGGISRPAVRTDQHRAERLCAGPDLAHQSVGKGCISRETHRPFQPQPCRDHQGQPHPGDHGAAFRPNFIRLNAGYIQFALFDQFLMHPLAMCACAVAPLRHRAFIQPIGMDNGLQWAAIGRAGSRQ